MRRFKMSAAEVTEENWRRFAHRNCDRHRLYQLNCEQLELLLDRSGGRCEVCDVGSWEVPSRVLYIDHHHPTGTHAVRGLVCVDCNRQLAAVDAGRDPTPRETAYLALTGFVTPLGWREAAMRRRHLEPRREIGDIHPLSLRSLERVRQRST